MTITLEQRDLRKSWLGASDIAALFGLDPFKNAADVFLAKTQTIEDKTTEAMDLGNRLEPVILDWAAEQLGPLERNPEKLLRKCPIAGVPVASFLDAEIIADRVPVEAKTSRVLSAIQDGEWGEDGTDELPFYVILQCQCQILCTGADMCHVPALIGGRGFQMYRVPRNEEVIKHVCEKSVNFWEQHVLTQTPPADIAPSLELVKRVRRVPNKIVDVDPQLVQDWIDAKDAAKAYDTAKEEAQAKLLAALGDAEAGTAVNMGVVNYMEQTRAEYVCKASTFRVLRFKKNGKKG